MANRKKVPVSPERKEGNPMDANENNFTNIVVKDRDGNKYTLEFNSRIVKRMERNGFKIDTNYPNTMVDELFTGAFQMHHKGITPEKVRDIWKYQTKKDELLGLIIKLYMKPLEDLMEEPEDRDNDDPTWETA